jgi:hypothetical protein
MIFAVAFEREQPSGLSRQDNDDVYIERIPSVGASILDHSLNFNSDHF